MNRLQKINGLINTNKTLISGSVFVTKIFFLFFASSSLLLLVYRLGPRGFNSRKTATDPEAPCGWAIPPRNPRTPFCRKVCHRTWDLCRADCRSCIGPGASLTPLGLPGIGRYSRHLNHLQYSNFSPSVAVCVVTLGLAPSELAMMGPRGRVLR